MAIESEGVREALRAYRKRAWIGLGASLVALGLFVVFASAVDSRATRLEEDGVRVGGKVVSVEGRGQGGTIVVSFADHGKERRTTVHLDSSSPDYEPGQSITVLIDPRDREHVGVAGETNQSPITLFPMVVLLVGGLLGTTLAGIGLARAGRQKRVLSSSAWRRFQFRYGDLQPRLGRMTIGNPRPLLLVKSSGARDAVLTLISIFMWTLKRSGVKEATEIEVAGPVRGHCVVRSPSSTVLLTARRPSTAGAERRWRQVFTDEV